MTPEAIQLITEWWVDCLRWGLILTALPMVAFVITAVGQAAKEWWAK